MTTSKITLATVKSFIKKNAGNIYIKTKSQFDGMTDCVEQRDGGFTEATETTENIKNTLGIVGSWVVGGSRNLFNSYQDNHFTGIEVYNCCGCFILAIKKENTLGTNMDVIHLNLNTCTKADIVSAANNDPELMSFLGGLNRIEDRDLETLRSLCETWLSLNSEVGAFYDKNGF